MKKIINVIIIVCALDALISLIVIKNKFYSMAGQFSSAITFAIDVVVILLFILIKFIICCFQNATSIKYAIGNWIIQPVFFILSLYGRDIINNLGDNISAFLMCLVAVVLSICITVLFIKIFDRMKYIYNKFMLWFGPVILIIIYLFFFILA